VATAWRYDRRDRPLRSPARRIISIYPDASVSRGKSTPDADIVEARFIELVPGARVVYAVDFVSDNPAYNGTMTMTWEMTPADGEPA
jgi:uncharacterized protein YndB with AHSA1/START domain